MGFVYFLLDVFAGMMLIGCAVLAFIFTIMYIIQYLDNKFPVKKPFSDLGKISV